MVKEDTNPARRPRRAGLLAVLAGLAVLALAPAAQASCNDKLVQPFKRYGDSNYYALAPGGTMESPTGWKLTGNASFVSGNEPAYVNSTKDSRSLKLAKGSSATSDFMCVDTSYTTLRFFGRDIPALATSVLKLEVLYKDPATGTVKALQTNFGSSLLPTWGLTSQIALAAGKIPLYPDGTGRVAFRLSTVSTLLGYWQVDDLYVDPRRR
ncbi:MAG TPA: hypothetical protein VGF21_11535 [Thermoleophilaceae bacterium]|jgi:hypothetical protein